MSDVTITLGDQRMGSSEPSAGEARTNERAPRAPSGIVNIRRNAALKALESEKSSGGNRRSNPPGHAASDEKRVGDVKAPAKDPADRNTGPAREDVPNRIGKEQTGDGWSKAATKARELLAR